MKKSILIFAAALLLAGCAKLSDAQKNEPLVKVVDDLEVLTFNRQGACVSGEASFEFSCNYDWKVASNASWAKIDVTEGKAGEMVKVKVTVDPNVNDFRTCEVNVFDKNMLTKTSINIIQDGVKFIVDETPVDMPFVDTVTTVSILTDANWTAEIVGEGFSLDKTSGEGSYELQIKTARNLAGMIDADKTAKVIVKTDADIKVNQYTVDITQSSGYCFDVSELSYYNVKYKVDSKENTKARADAKIEYVGTKTAEKGSLVQEAFDFPTSTSYKRKVNTKIDYYKVNPDGYVFGLYSHSTSTHYYLWESGDLMFDYGGTSNDGCPSRIDFPVFEKYRPYRVEVVTKIANSSAFIGENNTGVVTEIKLALKNIYKTTAPLTSTVANETWVWDISDKTVVNRRYFLSNYTNSKHYYTKFKVYYGK